MWAIPAVHRLIVLFLPDSPERDSIETETQRLAEIGLILISRFYERFNAAEWQFRQMHKYYMGVVATKEDWKRSVVTRDADWRTQLADARTRWREYESYSWAFLKHQNLAAA